MSEWQGLAAFEMARSSAIAHEAGHTVVGAVHGLAVSSCEITRRTIPKIFRRAVGRSAWGGLTRWAQPQPFGPAGEFAVEFANVPTATVLTQIAVTIAGVVAEAVFDPDEYRDGSSIDEVLVAQVLTDQLAARLGLVAPELWDLCWRRTAAVLKHNERVARAI